MDPVSKGNSKLGVLLIILLIALVLILTTRSGHNPPKKIYTLESIPTYDSLGNLYGTRKKYDHIPTHEDSVEFEVESEKEINDMINSEFLKK